MVLKSLKVPSKFCFSNKFRNSKYNELIWKYVAACCIFNINNNHLYHSETKKCRSASLKWRRIMCVTPPYIKSKYFIIHRSFKVLDLSFSQNSVFFCFQLFKKCFQLFKNGCGMETKMLLSVTESKNNQTVWKTHNVKIKFSALWCPLVEFSV